MAQAKPKLTYFDMEGRGEPVRLAFFIGDIEFEDHRVSHPQWPTLKPTTPWGALPILEVNGKVLAQSSAILRYVGRLTGLYPTDNWAASQVDEILDAVEDVVQILSPTFRMPDGPEKVAKRKELADGPLSVFLGHLEKRLLATGGKFFVGDQLSIADLKFLGLLRTFASGRLDGIPTTYTDRWPALKAYHQSIMAHPKVKAWYARPQPAK